MLLLLQSMRHVCKSCRSDSWHVVKTYPYIDFTLRHVQCNGCGAAIYTREYVMSRDEYCWISFGGKTRLASKNQ